MVFLCLLWKARNQRRPERDARYITPKPCDDAPQIRLRGTSTHPLQHRIARVLYWNIQITADLLLIADCIDQLLIHLFRVAILHPYPLYSGYGSQLLEKDMKPFLSI